MTMQIQTETQNEKAVSGNTSHCIPKQVWLSAWLAVFGAAVAAAIAIVNGGVTSASQMWSVAAPCISVALMMAVVCWAIVRYR